MKISFFFLFFLASNGGSYAPKKETEGVGKTPLARDLSPATITCYGSSLLVKKREELGGKKSPLDNRDGMDQMFTLRDGKEGFNIPGGQSMIYHRDVTRVTY